MKDDLYNRICRRALDDSKVRCLSLPQPNAHTLFMHLLAGPEREGIPGVTLVRASAIAERYRWTVEDVKICFAELEELGMASVDWDVGLVWMPNGLRHNRPQNPNMAKGIGRGCTKLPECALRDRLIRELHQGICQLDAERLEAFDSGQIKTKTGEAPKPFVDALLYGLGTLRSIALTETVSQTVTGTVPQTVSQTVTETVYGTVPQTVSTQNKAPENQLDEALLNGFETVSQTVTETVSKPVSKPVSKHRTRTRTRTRTETDNARGGSRTDACDTTPTRVGEKRSPPTAASRRGEALPAALSEEQLDERELLAAAPPTWESPKRSQRLRLRALCPVDTQTWAATLAGCAGRSGASWAYALDALEAAYDAKSSSSSAPDERT